MWVKRRHLLPILLFVLIFITLLTLSQILVIHSGIYGQTKSENEMKGFQKEIREVESNIRFMLKKDMPTMKQFKNILRLESDARRMKQIFEEAKEYSQFLGNGFSNFRQTAQLTCHNSSTNKSCNLIYQLYKSRLNDLQNEYYSKHDLPYCQNVPRFLKGPLNISLEINETTESSTRATLNSLTSVFPGGSWKPLDCMARHRVAIVVPYRDRLLNLLAFLSNIHPTLQRQELNYRIFVVEQAGNLTFNKARLMNAAFIEAMKLDDFDCFIFHDVDLIPEDDRNMYSCASLPRHLSVAIDKSNYTMCYGWLVGGVLNLRFKDFLMVNGYSNLYWGWGGEDDDMAHRLSAVGLRVIRPPSKLARYKMTMHGISKRSNYKKRLELLYNGSRRYRVDGLNSLEYKKLYFGEWPYYTYLLLDLGAPPTINNRIVLNLACFSHPVEITYVMMMLGMSLLFLPSVL